MIGKEKARATISMPNITKDAIEALADHMGVSFSSATQHLLSVGLTHEAIALRGGEIVAHLPGGEERVLADQSGNYVYRTPLTEW